METQSMYCTIDKIAIDNEAETTLTLKIPASNLEQVTALMSNTNKLLELNIRESDKKVYEL